MSPLYRSLRVLLFLALAASGTVTAQAPSVVATIPEAAGEAVAVRGSTMMAYIAQAAMNRIAVVEQTRFLRYIPVGRNPRHLAVDPANGRVYVSNSGDASLTVTDGASAVLATLPINGSGPIAIDSANNRIYVLRQGNNGEVSVVDGNTFAFYAIDTGSHTPADLVLNPKNRRLYVSHTLSGDVRAIDLTSTSDHPPTIAIQIAGHPGPLAYNSVTNKVYVLSDDARGPVVAIDGATHAAQPILMPGHGSGPKAVAVNARTNTIYAGFAHEIAIIDGSTHGVSYVPTGEIVSIHADPDDPRTVALDAGGNLYVIDGFTRRVEVLRVPGPAYSVAYMAKGGLGFVAGSPLAVVKSATLGDVQPADINVQGLWWNAGGTEAGWGVNLAHHGDKVFLTWFTYDEQGRPLWLAMTGNQDGRNSYSGTLYRTTGPAFNAVPFDPARVTATPVGTGRVSVANSDNATLSGTINGIAVTKQIARQVYASPLPTCTAGGAAGAQPNYQDLWWASPSGSESGWGMNITHQGDILFVTIFTYDGSGQPLWLVGSRVEKTGNATYAGTLYQTAGPPLAQSPWDPSRVVITPVGSVSLAFSDAGNGRLTYTVGAATVTKSITREVFALPATVCR